MAYQSPLGYNFKLDASISVVKKAKEEEINKAEEAKNKGKNGSKKKRKQDGPEHPVQYPKPSKQAKSALSYFMMNPTTPEVLLNDKGIRSLKRELMSKYEGASETDLRNVIRESFCTCFNFFSPCNLPNDVVSLVRKAIIRAWAAVDVLTYESVVNEVGGLEVPGKKSRKKKKNAQVVVPVTNSAIKILLNNHKSVQTHLSSQAIVSTDTLLWRHVPVFVDESVQTDVRFANAATMTANTPLLINRNTDSFYNDQRPRVVIKGLQDEQLPRALLLVRDAINCAGFRLDQIDIRIDLDKSICIKVMGVPSNVSSLCYWLKVVLAFLNLQIFVTYE